MGMLIGRGLCSQDALSDEIGRRIIPDQGLPNAAQLHEAASHFLWHTKHRSKVGRRPSSLEAFGVHAGLASFLLLEQVQRNAAQDGEVLRAIADPDSTVMSVSRQFDGLTFKFNDGA